MWTDMFVKQVPLLEKVLRVVLVYSLILVLTRVSGKLVLSLKSGEQSSAKDDILALTERLYRIEELLTTRAEPPQPPSMGGR